MDNFRSRLLRVKPAVSITSEVCSWMLISDHTIVIRLVVFRTKSLLIFALSLNGVWRGPKNHAIYMWWTILSSSSSVGWWVACGSRWPVTGEQKHDQRTAGSCTWRHLQPGMKLLHHSSLLVCLYSGVSKSSRLSYRRKFSCFVGWKMKTTSLRTNTSSFVSDQDLTCSWQSREC